MIETDSNQPSEPLYMWPAHEPMPEHVWRARVSGLLLDLAKEVRALTEVTHTLAVKLAEKESERGL